MEQPNVNLMTETQKRLYKKIQAKKALEEQKAKAEAEQAAAKKKKKNRKKKKSGAKSTETGEPSPIASQSSPNSENSDPSQQQTPALSTAAKKRRRRAAKKAAAAESSETTANGATSEPPSSSSPSPASPTDEKQEQKPTNSDDSESTTNTFEKEEANGTNKLEIDRSTFSDVQERLKQLEDEALGRRPMPRVKGAAEAPGWLGKDGNEKVLAGSGANAKHHVVTGADADDISAVDKAKMQALLGNAKATNTKSFVGLKDVTQTLTSDDYDHKMTVVFQSCKGCHFTLDSLCTKVFVQACHDFTITIDKKIITQTMELFRCTNVTANINVKCRTVQADMSEKITLKFDTKENFDNIVWAGCEELVTEFGDTTDRIASGWTDVQEEFAELNKERSQFKIHYVAGKLSQDKIIRMSDGFPTTKLEYDEYMRKQEAAIQGMAKNMGITISKKVEAAIQGNAKNMGITVSKKVKPKDERAGRNDPCPCGTRKKYKKCCGKLAA